jgi:hypothetical protein
MGKKRHRQQWQHNRERQSFTAKSKLVTKQRKLCTTQRSRGNILSLICCDFHVLCSLPVCVCPMAASNLLIIMIITRIVPLNVIQNVQLADGLIILPTLNIFFLKLFNSERIISFFSAGCQYTLACMSDASDNQLSTNCPFSIAAACVCVCESELTRLWKMEHENSNRNFFRRFAVKYVSRILDVFFSLSPHAIYHM